MHCSHVLDQLNRSGHWFVERNCAMRQQSATLSVLVFFLLVCWNHGSLLSAAEWQIPLAGNTWRTQPEPGGNGVRRGGTVSWSGPDEVYSVFVRADRPAPLQLQLVVSDGEGAELKISLPGREQQLPLQAGDNQVHNLGQLLVRQAGYFRIDFRGIRKTAGGTHFGRLQKLIVSSDAPDLTLDFVRNNDGGMFYWGRRGPSVHLTYQVPRDLDLEYGYCEITVPEGQDPEGTFYMASGFGEGYFGMQVNSPTERRVLFSVWSPYQTDNPRDIPEDQRIQLLASGEGVRVGEFGNEGSGGQSILIYPWQAGRTYRFLTRVVPEGTGHTQYTAWFGDQQQDEWRLIARFRRPKTDTHLRRFHSFLESFNPGFGHLGRRAWFGGVRVCDTSGTWHLSTAARFTVDATGSGRHRLDFTGGSNGDRFYLQNCGFFAQPGTPGTTFAIRSDAAAPPEIDLQNLPQGNPPRP